MRRRSMSGMTIVWMIIVRWWNMSSMLRRMWRVQVGRWRTTFAVLTLSRRKRRRVARGALGRVLMMVVSVLRRWSVVCCCRLVVWT